MTNEKNDDCLLQCDECEKTMEWNFAFSLEHGWPQCCGFTMRLVKYPDPKTLGEITAKYLRKRAMQ